MKISTNHYGGFYIRLPETENAQLKNAKRLRAIFIEIINKRKANNENKADLLDMLLKTKYEDTGESMSDGQIVDEVLILIFAGHETTANTLSWMLYLLSSNKEVLQKLTASFYDSTIYDCLNNEYLKATISEAMRLYPAAWMTERVAIEDDEFEEFSFPKKYNYHPFLFWFAQGQKTFGIRKRNLNPNVLLLTRKLQNQKIIFHLEQDQECVLEIISPWLKWLFFTFSFLKKFHIQSTGQIPEMKALITLRPDKILLSIQSIKA